MIKNTEKKRIDILDKLNSMLPDFEWELNNLSDELIFSGWYKNDRGTFAKIFVGLTEDKKFMSEMRLEMTSEDPGMWFSPLDYGFLQRIFSEVKKEPNEEMKAEEKLVEIPSDLRRCKVGRKLGYFHAWITETGPERASDGNLYEISRTYGLVEFDKDHKIKRVDPEKVTFI